MEKVNINKLRENIRETIILTFIASSIIVSWSSSVNVESNFIPVDGGEDEGSIADTKVVLELDIEVSNFDSSCITGQVISDVVSSKVIGILKKISIYSLSF